MIHVCYTCNEAYAMIVGVSMISMLENMSKGEVHFYVLGDKFSKQTKDKFNQIEVDYNCEIECIDISDKMAYLLHTALVNEPGMVHNGQLSYMYARLFMGSSIDESVDKLLYIDADTIFQGDVTKLYYMPLFQENIIAAIRDLWPINYNKVIGFAENDLYFQSGIMLVDLMRWRKENIEGKIIKYIDNMTYYHALHDQDIINICLKGKIQTLPVKYGMVYLLRKYKPSDIYFYSGKSEKSYYSSEEIEAAQMTREVIHYSGDYFGRPWVRPYACEDARIWESYFNISPWHDYNPFRVQKNVKYIVKKLLYPFISRIWLNRFKDKCWRINERMYQAKQ